MEKLLKIETRKATYKAFLPHPSKAKWVATTCPLTHKAITTEGEVQRRGLDVPILWREPEEVIPQDIERVKRIVEYCPQCQWHSERCKGIEGNKEFLREVLARLPSLR